jgi:hypothetical protein
MKKLISIWFTLLPAITFCQATAPACDGLKDGIFYNYPKNSTERIMQVRKGDLAKEVTIGQKDTLSWRIKWQDNCTYSLTYISGKIGSKQMRDFVQQHTLAFRIETVTADYYVYTGYYDDAKKGLSYSKDTMWLHEQLAPTNSVFLIQVTNLAQFKRAHFSDTSRYALLYIYRPAKFIGFGASYPMYFDNSIMCVVPNKSGFMFQVRKEGIYSIRGPGGEIAEVKVDIKLGKSYYVKTILRSSLFDGQRSEAIVMPEDKGKEEFSEVTLSTQSN